MKKLVILGLIATLSALAVQNGFFDGSSMDFSVVPKSPAPSIFNIQHSTFHPYTVTRVIDGDTIVVLVDGVSEKVRLIGVDTPETVDPRKPVQCFGKEASALTKSLLSNTIVKLEADQTQGDRDKYGRLLRYVFLPDGTLVNGKIIAEGYGHEYTYRIPYKYRDDFKTDERSARESQKGLWASDACKGS